VVREKGVTMGKYLDILRRAEQPHAGNDKNDTNDKRYTNACNEHGDDNQRDTFSRLCRFCRTLDELERRCPGYIDATDWQQAIQDGRRFVSQWGEQADALGWTARELFGLHPVPAKPHASFGRLSRCDSTGLVWLLHGRVVVKMTADSAVIRTASNGTLIYPKNNKPALGPFGENLDDMGPL
jgi:hypothetical protein